MANSAAHSVRGGFNQSGGAHFIVLQALEGKMYAYTPGTLSGGAATSGSVALVTPTTLAGNLTSPNVMVSVGEIIKDMGKSVVVKDTGTGASVTYRKFQAVQTPAAVLPLPGAGGQVGRSPEYFSFYLEVGREGQQGTTLTASPAGPAQIARYF